MCSDEICGTKHSKRTCLLSFVFTETISKPLHVSTALDTASRGMAFAIGESHRVAELVSFLSEVTTLLPGDLISTGNPDSPAFQRKLVAREELKAEIENIGAMNLFVGNA